MEKKFEERIETEELNRTESQVGKKENENKRKKLKKKEQKKSKKIETKKITQF